MSLALVPLWVACLAVVYVIWSSTYLALRFVVEALPPLLSSGVRYVLAGSFLFAIARFMGTRAPSFVEWRAALPTGALLCVVGNGFVALAERQVSSGLAAVTCAAMPIFACLFDAAFGLRPRPREWLGVLIGFVGVLMLGAGDLRARPSAAILLALAPIGSALASALIRRLPRAPGAMAAATQLLCGGSVNVLLALSLGERWPQVVPIRAGAAFVYLVVFGSMVGFSAYNYLLVHTRTAVATSYAYVNPLLALGLGALFAGEPVSRGALASTVLVIVGVAVVVTAPAHAPTGDRL